jgi:hypothetical protein
VTLAMLAVVFASDFPSFSPQLAAAGDACDVPATFSLAVEERPLLGGGGPGLVVVRSTAPSSSLRPGDLIRQANDRRTIHCADLETAAADALAKGLVLLLAAERDGRLFAMALPATAGAAAIAEPAVVAPAPPLAAPAKPPVAEARRAESEDVRAPVPTPLPTPIARREIVLPPRSGAPADLVAKAVAAAAVLGTVDEAARFTVPLAVYERRIGEAKSAIAALRLEGDGSPAVRSVVDEVFEYHEVARDIRRYKAAELADARVDQRGAGAMSVPYFSDSDVPRWIARYPFLSESLQEAPRTTHMLVPGEMAGRWNPDQAVELLWQRAVATRVRLGAWAGEQ